ncbi:MAG TPA: TQO small subunit DoxD [Gemmatimonadaceae bacterium]|nr:TQO small subunit DoxD [Gemmatimonadaceae bacterium]
MVQAAAVTTPDSRLARYYLAFATARVALGCYWLYEQHWKLPPDFGLHQPRGLMFAFEQSIRYPTLDLYRAFLQDVVVPNFHLFGWLLLFAEVAIGVSLVLGAFTRAGALLGVLQGLNLLIAQGRTPEGPWIYVAILAANVFVLLTPSNRKFSVDRRLASRFAARASPETLLIRVWRLASGCPTV